MKKTLFLLVLSFGLLFSSCTPKEQKDSSAETTADKSVAKDTADKKEAKAGLDIGIVLPTKDEPRWLQDEERFKAAFKDSKYSVEILFSQGSPAIEKANVETLLTKQAKVIVIAPHDGGAAAAAAEEAKKSGTTIISYDRLITGTDAITCYITFNSVAVGEMQGQYLVDKLGEKTGQKLFLYAGAASDHNAFLFFRGAWNILQPKIADGSFVVQNSSKAMEYKDVADLSETQISEIVGQISTEWSQSTAKTKAETDSANASGETFILAPNDGTARAIYDVFANTSSASDIHITGQDAEKPTIQSIMDGKQSMTVLKDVRKLVSTTVEAVKKALQGEEIPTNSTYNNGKVDVPSIEVPIQTITKDTVDELIFDSGYYDKADF